MTTQEVLKIVEARGLRVEVSNGQPVLRGETSQATPRLVAVLRRHRDRVLAALGVQAAAVASAGAAVECRWSNGHVERYTLADGFPLGAVAWRNVGEADWREVPDVYRRAAAREAKDAVRSWRTVDGGQKQ
jgi:hypothetical protein